MSDLISRQAALDALDKIFNSIPMEQTTEILTLRRALRELPSTQPDLDEWCTDCKEYDHERHCCPRWNRVIRETLKDAQQEQRWIPVSERLPKYNTPVLLALKQIGKERTIVIGERRTRKSGWYFVDIAAYDPEHKVIAWMPLPEPYREERTEE